MSPIPQTPNARMRNPTTAAMMALPSQEAEALRIPRSMAKRIFFGGGGAARVIGPGPLIAGNWKMNGLKNSADEVDRLVTAAGGLNRLDLMVCPPATLVADF